MLNQMVEVFKNEYDKLGDDLILDSYIPSDGTYVIVEPKKDKFEIVDTIDIRIDKKTNTIDRTSSKYFGFILFADYYSQLISMNKSILPGKGKIIQGNNYLSFIIKKESLSNNKLSNEIIDEFYDALENTETKYKKKKKTLELYKKVEKKVGKVNKERLNSIRFWIKKIIFEEFNNYKGNEYLKIFFHYPRDDYIKESERYYVPKIYNQNKYNVKIGNEIYGLHNNNMGMNTKKPYLENKTRKIEVPYLINQEDVLYQKKLFDFLKNNVLAGRHNIYIGDKIRSIKRGEFLEDSFDGMFVRLKKGKEVEIIDFDIVTHYNPKLTKIFEFNNILGVDFNSLTTEYGKIKTLKNLNHKMNEILFNKYLNQNFFTEPGDISLNDSVLKSNLLMCRTCLFNWFYKGNKQNVWELVNKSSRSLIKGSIVNGYGKKASDKFNFWQSLKEYFKGGNKMGDIILDSKDTLRKKISEKETGFIENDSECFFAVGQLVNYFISKSKGNKKPLSLANPFINAKNDAMIKEKLKSLYKKYNYDIDNYNYRFKGLYAMVASYQIEGKVNEDMIIAGYLHSNLLYEKVKSDK